MNPDDYTDLLNDEFKSLLSLICAFLDNWPSPETFNTFRFYAKRRSVNDALRIFINRLKNNSSIDQFRKHKAIDLQK